MMPPHHAMVQKGGPGKARVSGRDGESEGRGVRRQSRFQLEYLQPGELESSFRLMQDKAMWQGL